MAYDPFSDAKAQIDDGLGLRSQRMPPLSPPQMPPQPMQGHVAPNMYSMPAGAPNPGQQFGAPPMGPPNQPQPTASGFGGVSGGASVPLGPGVLDINGGTNPLFKLAQLAAQYNVGPASAGVSYQPGVGVGGNVRYNQGPVSAGVSYQPHGGAGANVRYQHGPFEVGGGYDPRRGAYGDFAVRQSFQEGGLATPQSNEDFVHNRDQEMHEVVGKLFMDQGGFAVRGGY